MRRHEWRRGTQECVKYQDILYTQSQDILYTEGGPAFCFLRKVFSARRGRRGEAPG
jgi:hypothetical protein